MIQFVIGPDGQPLAVAATESIEIDESLIDPSDPPLPPRPRQLTAEENDRELAELHGPPPAWQFPPGHPESFDLDPVTGAPVARRGPTDPTGAARWESLVDEHITSYKKHIEDCRIERDGKWRARCERLEQVHRYYVAVALLRQRQWQRLQLRKQNERTSWKGLLLRAIWVAVIFYVGRRILQLFQRRSVSSSPSVQQQALMQQHQSQLYHPRQPVTGPAAMESLMAQNHDFMPVP